MRPKANNAVMRKLGPLNGEQSSTQGRLNALAVALQGLAIEPEEAHLGRRFGAAYRAYCQRTRRWI